MTTPLKVTAPRGGEPRSVSPVLSVRDLVVEFAGPMGPLRAVDGATFDVHADETLAIVGESGSGKTVTMLAVMGLLPPGATVASGSIQFLGRDMVAMSNAARRSVLGKEIAIVFQDPLTSLNPLMKVGDQIGEMVRLHARDLSRAQVKARVIDLLQMVNIPNARQRYSSYPHEFSGGMRQRAMIAMAVAHSPAVLIADEPTTALDVTIQAQVLRVLERIRKEVGSSMVLITHDLGLVAEAADRVVVLYGGRVMETGRVERMFRGPLHPYTVGLLASSLRLHTQVGEAYAIPGQPPALGTRLPGCVFAPRCGLRHGRDICTSAVPPLVVTGGPAERVACHFPEETLSWAAAGGFLGTAADPLAPEASS